MSKFIIDSGADWTPDRIYEMSSIIEGIGDEMGYSYYTNQVEIISAEQMIDAYSSVGMPSMYKHWSFGKSFLKTRDSYVKGQSGLAYEIVINSNPCVVYIMEQNTELMQALVIAHAGIGHNHFFKNNQLFKQWTSADGILDYLDFAKKYIDKCEEKYGVNEVEKILDAAHSVQRQGVFRYPRKAPLSFKREMERKIHRALEDEKSYDDLWRTVPDNRFILQEGIGDADKRKRQEKYRLPEENILYFIEKHSPTLHNWQREVIRIVRNIAQYFYPQMQTQVMNEGCATYTHYTILNTMYDRDHLTDGAMIEFLKSHAGVVAQPGIDSPYYSGINPSALGVAMMQDIERVCHNPTEEDKKWFPDWAGCKDHMPILFDAWESHRDESFIRQFLSPKIIRDFKFFSSARENSEYYRVNHIHDKTGYRDLRTQLADAYDITNKVPEVSVEDVQMDDDRKLTLSYKILNAVTLEHTQAHNVVQNIANLWGYPVELNGVTEAGTIWNKIAKKPSHVLKEEYIEF